MSDDTKNLYNPHQGLTGRDGGPYLDEEERRLAEIRRAAVEGREPDFDKAPATAGTPLVTAGQLVGTANPASIPSQMGQDPYAHAVDRNAQDEAWPVNAFSERSLTDAEKNDAKAEESGENPAASTYVSHDPESVDAQTRQDTGVEELDEDADDDDVLDALTTEDNK